MKKIFSILVAAWMGVSAMAATITIEGSEFTGGDANNGKGAHVELKKDGITISTESGYADGKVLRVYQGGVVTITSTEVMTSIDFTCATDYVALNDATPNSTTYSVTVPTGGKHTRIEKIVITTNGEGGSTPDPEPDPDPTPDPTGTITVAKALEIGNALKDNTSTTESYTVVGYVGKIAKDYDTEKGDQCWFMTDDKNFTDSTYFEFEAYWCYINEPVAVGDYVAVTGPILKYVSNQGYTTIEIKNGQAEKLNAPMGVENAETDAVVVKRIENGQLIIRRGEKRYNVVGLEL